MFDFERAENHKEALKGGEGPESFRKFTVIRGGRRRGEAKIERPADALIREQRILNKQDVSALIEFLAETEGFKREDLILEMERYNPQGNLMALSFKIKDGRAEGTGFRKVIYEYTIKGLHGKGELRVHTGIERTFVPYDTRDKLQKDAIATYDESKDKWAFKPTKIVTPRNDIKPGK